MPRTVLGTLVAEAGLAVVVVGLFLPWTVSGTRSRDSFVSAAALGSLLEGTAGDWRSVLLWWPAVVALLAVAAWLLVALRQARGWLPVLAVAIAPPAVVAVAALGLPGRGVVHVAQRGPVAALVGVGLVVAGATIRLLTDRHARRVLIT